MKNPQNPDDATTAGEQIARALGLNANDITRIELEPLGSDPTVLIVTVTSQRMLHTRINPGTVSDLIDFITQHRLIPLDELDTTPAHEHGGTTYTTLDDALDAINELEALDDKDDQ